MTQSGVRRRLTIWYAVATLSLLLAALLAMRHFAQRALRNEHETAVAGAAALVRSFFRAELAEYRQVDVTVSHLAGELVFARMGIEFLRPDGSLFATARQPLAAATPLPPLVRRAEALEPRLAPGWQLRLTISTADLVAAQRNIDRVTLFAIPIAALVAALVAWWMTGRALSPISTMAAAADRLQNASGARLPVSNPDDEFGRLGLAFNRLLDRLDRAVQEQRRFLADAAHELRTPVARILGAAEERAAQPPSPADRDALTEIASELRRTAHTIDELLHLARADSGAMVAQRTSLYLDDVVSDAASRFARTAEQKGQAVAVTALVETPVQGDPQLIYRLATVLLENASRYTPEGGTIRIATRPSTDGGAELVVEDSGIGIVPEERESVFGRFVRGRSARQLAPEGAGLGLAIARSITTAHGGTLTVDDSELGGARFTATFPA
ncbi:MAG: HAMP domain-containing histidine kinase [Gemmatimonadetes bacterium]|nr:HAMP domain-containing histidine kinase [Gemmatimonadota bacterium]